VSSPLLVFRTDASETTGMGHFFRCLSLAKYALKADEEVHFVFKDVSENVSLILADYGISADVIDPQTTWEQEIRFLQANIKKKSKIFILDIAHYKTFSELQGIGEYTTSLRNEGFLAVIDGFKRTSFIDNEFFLDLDMLIAPYLDAKVKKESVREGINYLMGTEYMVFQEEYETYSKNQCLIPASASKILITFGGSDPFEITVKAINALQKINVCSLEVVVVVGPGFSSSLKKMIHKLTQINSHSWNVIYSPPTLASWMDWCDLAIGTTGLTKYELALMGVPSVFLSIDLDHAEMNKDFEQTKTGLHLGVHNEVTAHQLSISVQTLLDNQSERKQMSRNGLKLLDCNGSERILNALRENYYDKY